MYVAVAAYVGTVPPSAGHRQVVAYMEDFGQFQPKGKRPARVKAAHSALFFSPELQALHAQQMVNLLKHRNPYTGMTYAEDPAVAFVEIVNEQSILLTAT